MKAILLTGFIEPDEYRGSGHAFLLTDQKNKPLRLAYADFDEDDFIDVDGRTAFETIGLSLDDLEPSVHRIYFGLVSSWEFNISHRLV